MAERVIKILIEGEGAGQSVEKFLRQRLGLSRKQISRLKFREDGIRVNGVRQRVSGILQPQDTLELKLGTGFGGGKSGRVAACTGTGRLNILYEDRDLLAVVKPAGIVCHPSHGHYRDTLSNQAAAYLEARGEAGVIRLVGRLDKDTSGIVVFAKNQETAAAMARQREAGKMQKIYLALVEGCPPEKEGTAAEPLARDRDHLMKMRVSPDGKPARTYYRVLKIRGEGKTRRSLLLLTLEQGRTHQIRVHMAHMGCPLAGDPLYGRGGREDRAMLHAWKLRMTHPFSGEGIELEAELPEWAEF